MAITTLGMHIFSTYSGRGLTAARRDINRLARTLDQVDRQRAGTVGLNALKAAAVATAPALITLGQGAVYATGAFAAMAASAGASAGIFGAVMVAAARRAFALRDAGKALNEGQRNFVRSTDALSRAWNRFLDRVAPRVLNPATTAIRAITRNIGKLQPLIAAVGPVALRVARAFARWMDADNGFKRFIGTLTRYGVPALNHLQKAARHVLGFLGIGFRAFAPEGVKMAAVLERGARALHRWARQGGFQRFIANVKANGPAIRAFFSALGAALKNVAIALGGMAPAALRLSTVLLRIVAALPPSVIQAMVYAYSAWKVATVLMWLWQGRLVARLIISKAVMLATRAATIAVAVASRVAAVATRIWAAAVWLVNIALRANPIILVATLIGVLVAAIVWVATKTRFFQTVWKAVWGFVKRVALSVWSGLRASWRFTVNVIMGLFRWIGKTAPKLWRGFWRGIRAVGRAVWGAIRKGWNFTVRIIVNAFRWIRGIAGKIWRGFWVGVRAVGRVVWNSIRKGWNFTVRIIVNAFRWIRGIAGKIWRGFWVGVRAVGRVVWNSIRKGWNFTVRIVVNAFRWLSRAGRNSWRFMWSLIRKIGRVAWNSIRKGWNFTVRIVVNAFRWLSRAARNSWRFLWNMVRKIGKAVWNALRRAWNFTTRTIVRAMRWMRGIVSGSWRGLWNLVRKFGKTIWAIIRRAWNFTTRTIVRAMRWMRGVVSGSWRGLWNLVRAVAKRAFAVVRRGVNAFVRGVRNAFRWCIRHVKRIWGFLKGITKGPVKFFVDVVYNKGLRRAWNSTFAKIPGVHSLPKAPGFAQGGKIPGSGDGRKDRVPIMAAPGEYMMRRKAVKRIGVANLEAMNTGRPMSGSTSKRPASGSDKRLRRMRRNQANGQKAWKNHALGGQVMPGMALGGLFDGDGGLFGFLKNVGKLAAGGLGGWFNPGTDKGYDWAGGIFLDVVGPLTKAFFKPFKGMINGMSKQFGGSGQWMDYIKGNFFKAIEEIINYITSIAQDTGNGFKPFRPWQAGDGRRVSFGGVTVDYRTSLMLKKAQHIAKKRFSMFQGSWSHASASAGTHSGGGAVDLGATTERNAMAMRASGFAAWPRGRKWGSPSFSPHIHGIAVGDKLMSGAARAQVKAFFKGRDGLAGNGPDPLGGGGGGGKGVARWRGLAMRAMRMGGLRVNGYTVGRFLSLMRQESNGNPRATNNWDSNARSGNASRGLMQVIPSTFKANHVKGTSWNIFDPLANMAAAARYIKRKYGGRVPNSPYALGGLIKQMASGGAVNSFDAGGMLPKGLSLAYNGTGKPEPVGHDLGGGGASYNFDFRGSVFSGSKREFEDMIVKAMSDAERKGRVTLVGRKRGS